MPRFFLKGATDAEWQQHGQSSPSSFIASGCGSHHSMAEPQRQSPVPWPGDNDSNSGNGSGRRQDSVAYKVERALAKAAQELANALADKDIQSPSLRFRRRRKSKDSDEDEGFPMDHEDDDDDDDDDDSFIAEQSHLLHGANSLRDELENISLQDVWKHRLDSGNSIKDFIPQNNQENRLDNGQDVSDTSSCRNQERRSGTCEVKRTLGEAANNGLEAALNDLKVMSKSNVPIATSVISQYPDRLGDAHNDHGNDHGDYYYDDISLQEQLRNADPSLRQASHLWDETHQLMTVNPCNDENDNNIPNDNDDHPRRNIPWWERLLARFPFLEILFPKSESHSWHWYMMLSMPIAALAWLMTGANWVFYVSLDSDSDTPFVHW